jgi:fluoride exporter
MRRRVDFPEIAAIFVGGFAGALLRAGLAETLADERGEWPWATFAANAFGAFLLGLVVTRLDERLPPSSYRRPLLGTGFCGALTTFSTMQLELIAMLDEDRVGLTLAYAAASIAAGFAAVTIATNLVRTTGLRA